MTAVLPEAARSKLAAIRASATDAAALVSAAVESANKLGERRMTLGRELANLRSDATPDQRKAMTAELKAIEVEITEVEAKIQARVRRRDNDARIAREVDRWLSALPAGTVLTEVAVLEPDIVDPAEAIEHERATVAALSAEARTVRAAPLPLAEHRPAIIDHVAGLAARGRPTIAGHSGKLTIDWHQASGERIDPSAVLAWLDPAAMVARLEAEVGSVVDAGKAMGWAAKATRLAQIETDVLAAGHREEALVALALRRGIDVSRRRDASPSAILGVAIGEAKAKRKAA